MFLGNYVITAYFLYGVLCVKQIVKVLMNMLEWLFVFYCIF